MQEKTSKFLERYKTQIDLSEENNPNETSSEGSDIIPSQLTSTINSLSNEISLLNKKRLISSQTISPSIYPISHLYSTLRSSSKAIPFDKPNNFTLLSRVFQDYAIDKSKNEGKKTLKKIGITAEDISSIQKFSADFKKLPKFGKIIDVQFFEQNYTNNSLSNQINRNLEGKVFIKRNISSYSIDRQNSEIRKNIEQRRQKYKNYPKETKEKMDKKRLKSYWEELAKHEIPKIPKAFAKTKNEVEGFTKRIATLVQKEIRKKVNKVQRAQKECNLRARKLQKEMLVYWKKREKEIVDIQKKREKIEIDKKKKEIELQEQIIQKKRMEYLLKQSDIYSLMMYKHLGAFMPQEEKEKEETKQNVSHQQKSINPNQNLNPNVKQEIIAGNNVLVNTRTNKILFHSIKVDIDENKAKEDVNKMINQQRQKASEFDQQLNKIRKTFGGKEVKQTKFEIKEIQQHDHPSIASSSTQKDHDIQIESLDKPMINNSSSQLIEVPKNFNGELKEYQLKGLRWLDNLYEQGINGILADEMGLGKTIQAIAFLAHLSEEKNNWGPFLVIAPNATLYNWQQEFNRFCPSLKVLPYWGPLKDRKTLKKFFNSQLYVKSSPFHVCITSYNLVTQDEKVFHKVGWSYMILDEAQAIKNIHGQRWNILLSFNCRNRLLLSGTPIQNSMSELWALLHFIMPNLFDSHEQFQEWFSKDIEAHSQDKGELNKEQLKRLHKILKPFMLRRVKKDVEHEIGPKKEFDVPCTMTEKQKILYNSIKEKLGNISDLFMSTDSKAKAENLMNLVMQFRKVCNHPELFERNFGKIPFTFRNVLMDYECENTFTLISGDILFRTNTNSLLYYHVPKMIFDFCFYLFDMKLKIPKRFNIFEYNYVSEELVNERNKKSFNSIFNFFHFLLLPLSDIISIISRDQFINHIVLLHFFTQQYKILQYYKSNNFHKCNNLSFFINDSLFWKEESNGYITEKELLPPLIINNILTRKSMLNHKIIKHRFYIPKAIAFLPSLITSNRQMEVHQNYINNSLIENKILYGVDYKQFNSSINLKLPNISREIILKHLSESNGLLTPLFYQIEGYTQIELPSFDRLISDCAKLKKLDELLKDLSKDNHRVLIFCQMTHMLDILEEYMSKRKYIYFRMDGSTNIADRRDMINEFQTNPKIFAFLLSTRAGGLGVNLTGADTVIFYDIDWNPTMDAQATDRAHRIGQTKIVTVYRLITAGTVEERILKRAQQKQNVQTTVYSGGAFKADIFKQNDIVELLYSEEEMQKMEQDKKRLLLELNNGVTKKDEGNVNGNANGNNNTNGGNAMGVNAKSKKKKGKKEKKVEKRGSTNKKKGEIEESGIGGIGQSNKGVDAKGKNGIQKNLFAVRNNNEKNEGKRINAIQLDSSDEENNVIIDDGEHPINLDDVEVNEEIEDDEMEID